MRQGRNLLLSELKLRSRLMLVNPPELRIAPMATLKPLPNDN